MSKKLLITLPCNVGPLRSALEKFDKCDVVVCQYDGDGDSLYVSPIMGPLEKPKPESKDITDPVRKINEFVQTLEAANKATEGSQMIFR